MVTEERERKEETIRTWDRLPDESPRKYQLFCLYLSLTSDRSLRELSSINQSRTKTVPRISVLKSYSTIYNWVSRANDYDSYIGRKLQIENEQAIIAMNRRQAEAGHFLQDQALESMKKEDPNNLVAREKHERFRLGVETERKARGEKEIPQIEHKGQVNIKFIVPKELEDL